MAFSAFFSCTTSRGLTLPTATFEIIRSRSPIWCSCSLTTLRNSGFLKKYSTTSRRSSINFVSFSGKTSHRRSIRPPIGVTVRSMMSSNDLPSSCIGRNNSSERTVNLSRRTNFSSSKRLSDVIWFKLVCWVISRYCMIAPEAIIPSLRCSIPKPLSDLVPKCFNNFWRAFCSVNTQSSSSNMQFFVPK